MLAIHCTCTNPSLSFRTATAKRRGLRRHRLMRARDGLLSRCHRPTCYRRYESEFMFHYPIAAVARRPTHDF